MVQGAVWYYIRRFTVGYKVHSLDLQHVLWCVKWTCTHVNMTYVLAVGLVAGLVAGKSIVSTLAVV